MTRLARRDHSEGELKRKMERAGYPATDISKTLTYLRDHRYVDDWSFARAYARGAVERKHWGPARVARALRERGLDELHVQPALRMAFAAGEDELATEALRLYRRRERARFERASPGDERELKARAYRHLLGKGFSHDAARKALERAGLELDEEA